MYIHYRLADSTGRSILRAVVLGCQQRYSSQSAKPRRIAWFLPNHTGPRAGTATLLATACRPQMLHKEDCFAHLNNLTRESVLHPAFSTLGFITSWRPLNEYYLIYKHISSRQHVHHSTSPWLLRARQPCSVVQLFTTVQWWRDHWKLQQHHKRSARRRPNNHEPLH